MIDRDARSFELWRQDDNGQRFLVDRFDSRQAAQLRQDELSAGGHRQIYWIEAVGEPAPQQVGNLFAHIPAVLPDELTETLLETNSLHLERIISRQHATKPGQWYDQDQDEWVLLMSGSAEICFADPEGSVVLKPGDHLLIPAHRRHRVAWTDPLLDTVWLALFIRRNDPTS